MLLGGLPGGIVRHGQRSGGAQRLDERRPRRADRRARPPPAGTNSGWPPTVVPTTGRADASASSAAWPNGSTSDGWQRTSAAATKPGITVVRDRAGQLDAGAALELSAQRPDADERQRPLAEPLERAREPDDVLPLRQRADADEPRAVAVGARGGRKRSRSTPQSTTSVFPRASGTAASSRSRSQPETAIDRRGAARRPAASRAGPARAPPRSRRPGRAR